MEHIDPTKSLNIDHFCELFDQLPLTDEEKHDVRYIYWPLYELCLSNTEVTPEQAWLATKNTFIAKEPQVGERIEAKTE